MTDRQPACLYCHGTQDQIPLMQIRFQGKEHFICPQHLPILIHKPEQLESFLPGVSATQATSSDG